jgi:hypothetical protein
VARSSRSRPIRSDDRNKQSGCELIKFGLRRTPVKRTFAILAMLAVVAVAVFVVLVRTGVIDMSRQDAIIPSTTIPHSANEKPMPDQTTGGARR